MYLKKTLEHYFPSMSICTMLLTIFTFACDDTSDKSGCSLDDDCARGLICQAGSCQALPCNGLLECPGEGRTCLADLKSCSVKECDSVVNDVARSCSAGLTCSTDPSFKYTCVSNVLPTVCQSNEQCNGQTCCNGTCQATCNTVIIPDMMVQPVVDMMTQTPVDMAVIDPPTGGLCSSCTADDQCARAIGPGAKCTPIGATGQRYCTSLCENTMNCPSGFSCLDQIKQCLPANFQCVACLVTPCSSGLACNLQTGACEAPKGLCGTCIDDDACQQGLTCGQIGSSKKCVKTCAQNTDCPTDNTCTNGACIPNAGRCDACQGACGGDTPYCVESTATCAACGPGVPCANGASCNLQTNTCSQNSGGACTVDMECLGNPAGNYCVGGRCVKCLQDSHCGPRFTCNPQTFACDASPCGGVTCQSGSQCDPSTGRCTPGCMTSSDCVDPMTMECNAESGQCYNRDASCDLGGTAVCAPGGVCNPGLLDPAVGSCSCAKVNPMDFSSPDLISCHPGQTCFDLSGLGLPIPPACAAF
jgi:hypothetical protein